MRDLLTGDDLFAEILLLQGTRKAIIIVEGPSDAMALDPHLLRKDVYVIPGYGKPSVEKAVTLSDAQNLRNVLAILDRDWVDILDSRLGSENVVYTDLYDLDATIIFAGDVCRRIFSNFCDPRTMQTHLERTAINSPAEFVMPPSMAVGTLRLLARELKLQLSLRDFPITSIMDMDGGAPDVEKMIVIAAARSAHGITVDKHQIAGLVRSRMAQIDNPIRYCSGHDLSVALAGIMRKKWGCAVKADVIMKAFRAAFGCADLISTSMYRDIHQWAAIRSVAIWSCVSASAVS